MARILLVEPDRVLADTYRRALETAGHKVAMCAGAQSAVFCADEYKPDLVILEPQLIGHSGIEFLYEFRSYTDWTEIPVVILSVVPGGEFSDSWELLSQELGVKAYHYKPLTNLRKLLDSIDELIATNVGYPS